jgi:hypothetical protein
MKRIAARKTPWRQFRLAISAAISAAFSVTAVEGPAIIAIRDRAK